MGCQRHALSALPLGDLALIGLEVGWASEPVWTGAEYCTPFGINVKLGYN